jgi:hypothetical protein
VIPRFEKVSKWRLLLEKLWPRLRRKREAGLHAGIELAMNHPLAPVIIEGELVFPVNPGSLLPTHCEACGVPLMGGATVHKEGCAFLAIIRREFPNYQR